MALSNTFKEPRREIIETVMGLFVAGPLVYADYLAAVWLQDASGGQNNSVPWQLGMFLFVGAAIFLIAALFLAAVVIHAAGEGICAILKNRGFDPRPNRRY